MRDVLVACYARHDSGKKIASEIATKLHGKVDAIEDSDKYQGKLGRFRIFWDYYIGKRVMIKYHEDPKDYTVVVVVSPVWGGKPPFAVKAYINQNIKEMKHYGFILYDRKPITKESKQRFYGIMPKTVAELTLQNEDIGYEVFHHFLEDFADRIRVILDKEEKNGN